MGLENFGVKGGRPKKKETNKKNNSSSESEDDPNKRYKFYLSCNKRCGFKRVLRKRSLDKSDYICPKCGKKLKLTKKE